MVSECEYVRTNMSRDKQIKARSHFSINFITLM